MTHPHTSAALPASRPTFTGDDPPVVAGAFPFGARTRVAVPAPQPGNAALAGKLS